MRNIFLKATATVFVLVLVGCDANVRRGADSLTSAKDQLCVAQVRADQVEIIRLDGTLKRRDLPRHDAANWPLSARIASDGSFAVGASGTSLVALRLSGAELWRLENVSPLGLPAISHDRKRIAFTGVGRRLMIYDTTRRDLRSSRVSGLNPALNSDGSRIAFDDGGQVSVHDLNSGSTGEIGTGTEPSWAPGGKLAIRVSSERVDLIDLSTKERHPLLAASSRVSVPVWSPGGELMMFNRRGSRHWWSLAEWAGSEPNQVVVRNVGDGREISIGEYFKANHGDYTWVTSVDVCSPTR